MRLLICPQEFKGSLTAGQAASAIARGARRALGLVDMVAMVVERPLADGGPGTLDILATLPRSSGAGGGTLRRVRVTGPLGEAVPARFALLPRTDGPPLAVVESAQACGLLLLPAERRDPAQATTRGVGELIAAALAEGAREVVVGVGGSGTNDGGAGAARALGLALRDAEGAPLAEGGAALVGPARVELAPLSTALASALDGARLRIAVDVTSPLLGPLGATAVYGPQKGVDAALARTLEAGLARWAERCRDDLSVDIEEPAGAGAGGGLAAGLLAAAATSGATASVESGAALVGEAVGLRAAARRADLVITGEGRLDAQSGFGKSTAHAADVATAEGRACLAVCGEFELLPPGIADAEEAGAGRSTEEAMRLAPELVSQAAERLVTRYLRGAGRRGR
jgi:glycerate kinase